MPTQAGIIATRLLFTKDRSGDFEYSHRLSGSLFKDSLLDGLTASLNQLAAGSSETPSPSRSRAGSAKESKRQS
jgi:hypothetical protein